ncbi:MAG TPA: hypothetical protein VI193_08240 [Acidimicrobiia bacterium]
MIDIRALRKLTEGGKDHLDIDHAGALVDRGELNVEGPAVLFVVPVTDAVKVVVDDLVLDSLDRDDLWSIQGFRLEHEVLLVLQDEVSDPQSLVEAVAAAGFVWQVIHPTTGVL